MSRKKNKWLVDSNFGSMYNLEIIYLNREPEQVGISISIDYGLYPDF